LNHESNGDLSFCHFIDLEIEAELTAVQAESSCGRYPTRRYLIFFSLAFIPLNRQAVISNAQSIIVVV